MSSVGTTNTSSSECSQPRSGKSISQDVLIYNMPLNRRRDLCTILDRSNTWEDLAERMGYTKPDINNIKYQPNRSPTEELLSLWGDQNHTVTELFMLLYRLQQYLAMDCIRDLVDYRYHRLILKDLPDLCALLSNQSLQLDKADAVNFNGKKVNDKSILSEKILNAPQISREENESEISKLNEKSINKSAPSTFDNINELASSIPQIDYTELVLATDNWSRDNILGKGGFGTVFKGDWKYTAVAIKRLEYHGSDPDKNTKVQIQQSLNELRYLNSCRHDNILPLYGFSMDGKEPCLVYQLMAGGSLEKRLAGRENSLDLRQRLNIAIGTARGLQYLHTFNKKPLIHGDIKPANILLDPCNQPKIGDFGLAREGISNTPMEVSRVYGTKPYLPAEFLENHTLSTKVDTYSFGVVLFEMATGLRPYDRERGSNAFLTKHMRECVRNAQQDNHMLYELMDKSFVRTKLALTLVAYMINLGMICTNEKAHERPEMVAVLHYLAEYLIVNKEAFASAN